MTTTIQTINYTTGKEALLSVYINGDASGCKGSYTIKVQQLAKTLHTISGNNYNDQSSHTHTVLSSSEATVDGARITILIALRKMESSSYNFEIKLEQDGVDIMSTIKKEGKFTGEAAVHEYEIFCS